ncbi:MAG: hypothetical protein KDB27_20780 [Planctomycetales bacterium]|nr:hypothetical protein [Planctomycetales bacterium]
MQFIAQVRLADSDDPEVSSLSGILLLFACQNQPGMCDDWDADSGANAALLVAPGDEPITAPLNGVTKLDLETFLSLEPYDSSLSQAFDDDNYVAAVDGDGNVLGKIGGGPVWKQGDETPSCECGQPMRFVALLEERGESGVNFGGGGCGFAFICTRCNDKAKFLWQC